MSIFINTEMDLLAFPFAYCGYMAGHTHISVCTDLHVWYCRSVTRGVLRFAMTRPDWFAHYAVERQA